MEPDTPIKLNNDIHGNATPSLGTGERRGSICHRKISNKQRRSIQKWLNTQLNSDEGVTENGGTTDIFPRGDSFDDDLNLGAEARVFPNQPGRDTMVRLKFGPSTEEAQERRRAFHKSNFQSITSEESAASSVPSSTCTSVEQLLEERKPNAEEILRSLGFVTPAADTWASKVPMRFLTSHSHAQGIDVKKIIADNDELKRKVNNDQSALGSFMGHSSKSSSKQSSSSGSETSLPRTSNVPYKRLSRTISLSSEVFQGVTEHGNLYNSILICDNTHALQKQGHYDETLGIWVGNVIEKRPVGRQVSCPVPKLVYGDENENYSRSRTLSEVVHEEYLLENPEVSNEDQDLLKPHAKVMRSDSDSTLVPEKSPSFASDSFNMTDIFGSSSQHLKRPLAGDERILCGQSKSLIEDFSRACQNEEMSAVTDSEAGLVLSLDSRESSPSRSNEPAYVKELQYRQQRGVLGKSCNKDTLKHGSDNIRKGETNDNIDNEAVSGVSDQSHSISGLTELKQPERFSPQLSKLPMQVPKTTGDRLRPKLLKLKSMFSQNTESFELEEIQSADETPCGTANTLNGPLTRTISMQSDSSGFADYDSISPPQNFAYFEEVPEVDQSDVEDRDALLPSLSGYKFPYDGAVDASEKASSSVPDVSTQRKTNTTAECQCEDLYRSHSSDCLNLTTPELAIVPVKRIKLKSFRSISLDLGMTSPCEQDSDMIRSSSSEHIDLDVSKTASDVLPPLPQSAYNDLKTVSNDDSYRVFADNLVGHVLRQALEDERLVNAAIKSTLPVPHGNNTVSSLISKYSDNLAADITDSALSSLHSKAELTPKTDNLSVVSEYAETISQSILDCAFLVVNDRCLDPSPAVRKTSPISPPVVDVVERLLDFEPRRHGNLRGTSTAAFSDFSHSNGLGSLRPTALNYSRVKPTSCNPMDSLQNEIRTRDNCDMLNSDLNLEYRCRETVPTGDLQVDNAQKGLAPIIRPFGGLTGEDLERTDSRENGRKNIATEHDDDLLAQPKSNDRRFELPPPLQMSATNVVENGGISGKERSNYSDTNDIEGADEESVHDGATGHNDYTDIPQNQQTFLSESYLYIPKVVPKDNLQKRVLLKNQQQHAQSSPITKFRSSAQIQLDSRSQIVHPLKGTPLHSNEILMFSNSARPLPSNLNVGTGPRATSTPDLMVRQPSLASELMASASDNSWMLENDSSLNFQQEGAKLPEFTTRGPSKAAANVSVPSPTFMTSSNMASFDPSQLTPSFGEKWNQLQMTSSMSSFDPSHLTASNAQTSSLNGRLSTNSWSRGFTPVSRCNTPSRLTGQQDTELLMLSSLVRSPSESLNDSISMDGRSSFDGSDSIWRLREVSHRMKLIEEAKLMKETLKKYKADICLLDLVSSKQVDGRDSAQSNEDALEGIHYQIQTEILKLEASVSQRLSALISGDYSGEDLSSLHQMQVLESMITLMKEQLYHQHVLRTSPNVSASGRSEMSWQRTESPMQRAESPWQQEREVVLSELSSLRRQIKDQEELLKQTVNDSFSKMKTSILEELRKN